MSDPQNESAKQSSVSRSNTSLKSPHGSHSNDSSNHAQIDKHLDDLIKEYRRSQPKFKKMAKHARHLCEKKMSKQIPAILSQRCKDAISLKVKMQTKYDSGIGCETFEDAREKHDIPDLAAMRIALYYPNQNEEVESFLKEIFEVVTSKKLRKESGYDADHYTVRFKEDSPKDNNDEVLFDQEENDVVEIQVVSVLSHTWSQVEHKIKYKREIYTPLSPTEQRILKGLSGLVGSGDLLLEELYEHQRENTRVFEDEYELGSWLWKNIPKDSLLCMGDHRASDQKVLCTFLNIFEVNTPSDLGQVLKQICPHENTRDCEIQHKFDAFNESYCMTELRTSVFLMDHMLSEVDGERLAQIVTKAKSSLDPFAYKCQTVLNALNWLHELFDHNTDDDQFSTILTNYHDSGNDERMSLQWAYTDIFRESIAEGHEPASADGQKMIQYLWDWMAATKHAALKLVFQIAKCGVWQKTIRQLLKQLGNRQPHYVHSRESIRDMGANED